jgi:predicted DNA-binding transcriptional regulator AlpA
MKKYLSIAEVSAITGLSEDLLRKLDDECTFPATRTVGGHRRWLATDVFKYEAKRPFQRKFEFIVKQIGLDNLKLGVKSFLPKQWQDLNLHIGLVAKSHWKFDSGDTYRYIMPNLPMEVGSVFIRTSHDGLTNYWQMQMWSDHENHEFQRFQKNRRDVYSYCF